MHISKNKRAKCWMARIMRQGKKYNKNFTVRQYGSWSAAEKAARKWVKEMLAKLPPAMTRRGQMTDRNESGVVGVWALVDRHKINGRSYEYCRWGARWPDCPIGGGIRFSVNKHGDDDAFVLACLAVENECVDRKWLARKLSQIKGTARYRNLLKKKMVSFVDA